MRERLLDGPAWYVAGPAIGLIVVALVVTINERLGVVGGYSEVIDRVARRTGSFGWKAFFLFGVVGGGLLFGVLSGGFAAGEEYGWLSRAFGEAGDGAVAAVLLVGGTLIGYGAKTAGGCTAGNGLSGASFGSPASIVATMTFMATAVATAFATSWVFGGS